MWSPHAEPSAGGGGADFLGQRRPVPAGSRGLVLWSPGRIAGRHICRQPAPGVPIPLGDRSYGSVALDVWRVHPDGSGLAKVTTDGLFNGDAAWSPDGSCIVYVRNTRDGVSQTEDRGIYSIAPDGTGRTQLSASPFDGRPAWSPSGNQIAFVHSAGVGADDEIRG